MSTFSSPVQLSNIFKPKIWGRRDLAPLFAAPDSTESAGGQFAQQRIGEVWITDDVSRFLNGPAAGMTLAEASKKYGPELHGKSCQGRRFPLLAKYIFTSDWLSVQVHPDDAYAAVHDAGNLGKCEMWYFLKADPDAAILLGLKHGVTKQQLPQVFKDGTSRNFLQSFRPQPEEAVFLPPGMVHALGPGLLLFEVEENSDLTTKISTRDSPGLMLLRRQVRRTPQTQTLSRWATATLCLSLNYSNHRLSVAQAEERGAFGSKGFYESLVLKTARRRNNCLKTWELYS